MNQPKPLADLIGFMLGALISLFMALVFIALYNALCRWQGRLRVGCAMMVAIPQRPLGD